MCLLVKAEAPGTAAHLLLLPPSAANKPPTFHQPQDKLQSFAGENFVFQFTASDPEGSALLFRLDGGPEGALLSPAGLLLWRVPEEQEEEEEEHGTAYPVHVTLLDECNAQSSFTVEVTEEEEEAALMSLMQTSSSP